MHRETLSIRLFAKTMRLLMYDKLVVNYIHAFLNTEITEERKSSHLVFTDHRLQFDQKFDRVQDFGSKKKL